MLSKRIGVLKRCRCQGIRDMRRNSRSSLSEWRAKWVCASVTVRRELGIVASLLSLTTRRLWCLASRALRLWELIQPLRHALTAAHPTCPIIPGKGIHA